jgi:hypothetical protein
MKAYFKNLWLAILNKKVPSGLEPNTWYMVSKKGYLDCAILTDKHGHIVPFVKHSETFTWSEK